MSDFPGIGLGHQAMPPPFLHTWSCYSALWDARGNVGAATPATLTWVTNLCTFVPVAIPFAYPVRRVFWVNGSQAAYNADVGIYTPDGAKLYSTGSVAMSGANAPQFVTPTAFWLPAGRYLFAIACSGTNNAFFGSGTYTAEILRFSGVLEQASTFPLAESPTLAAPANAKMALFGVTWTDSGF